MRILPVNKFLSRIGEESKFLFTSLALVAALSACSSKHGATTAASGDDSAASSELKSEEDMMLGNSDETTSSDLSVNNNSLESLPAAEPEHSSPTKSHRASSAAWHGSLKSKYTPGMPEWTVKRGESLSLIAGAVYGKSTAWKKLVALNPELKNPNSLEIGQKLRLPGSEGEAAAVVQAPSQKIEEPTPVAEAPKTDGPAAPQAANPPPPIPTVSNPDTPPPSGDMAVTPPAGATGPDASAPGAMGVVDNKAAINVDSPAAAGTLNNVVKRVDLSGDKVKLRNILLGVAAFFLLLSGLIFVLSRRKAKAA